MSASQQQRAVVPREAAPRPIDPGVNIGHVHLKTADIDRIKQFYVDVLGFDVILRMGDDALFIAAGGYHHTLGFNTWESKGGTPPPPGTTGLYHVAIRYPTRAALGDALRRLIRAGHPLTGVNDHGTHEALYLDDPDGNGLELCWDRDESEWPRDAEGHLTFGNRRLDLAGLMAEGVSPPPGGGETATGAQRRRSASPRRRGAPGEARAGVRP